MNILFTFNIPTSFSPFVPSVCYTSLWNTEECKLYNSIKMVVERQALASFISCNMKSPYAGAEVMLPEIKEKSVTQNEKSSYLSYSQ